MKKILFLSLAFAVAAIVGVQAQTFNFNKSGEWWIGPKFKEMISITKEQSPDGATVVKFDVSDFGEEKFVSIVSTKMLPLVLPAGTYSTTVKLFVEKAPAGFNINIKNRDGSNYKGTLIPLRKVESGKWIEVKADITLEEISDGQLIVTLSNAPRSGTGTIYIDDITFTKR